VTQPSDVFISIVIATKGRLDSLGRLLESLCCVDGRDEIQHEIIIANNASDHTVAAGVDELVERWQPPDRSLLRVLRVKQAGKAFATNSAIPFTRGNILAFLDDDVAVAPGWLRGVADFFRNYPFAAMQGAILLPPETENDAELHRVYYRYRTICLWPRTPAVKEIKTLTGANMAIRKELFLKVGQFDVRLGPGRSGTSDDTELAERIARAGARIGCAPNAVVYHEVDWNRLTEDYFRYRHEQQVRSRFIYKNNSFPRILADLGWSLIRVAWHTIRKDERKKYRAKGRSYHYRAMLWKKLGQDDELQRHASTRDRERYSQNELQYSTEKTRNRLLSSNFNR
jgi:cellulose synthase/poly-beta-1,6-N-acetylglucosamine synthase-like glycosyltransferase